MLRAIFPQVHVVPRALSWPLPWLPLGCLGGRSWDGQLNGRLLTRCSRTLSVFIRYAKRSCSSVTCTSSKRVLINVMATAVALALQDLMQMASKVEPLDPAVIQRTRDTLGKIIAKPPLTDKLLSRPPFRYLHDIITEVMRTTGFLDGLYSAEELNVNNIQYKEQKMKFLQKAADAVSKLVSCGAQLCFSDNVP